MNKRASSLIITMLSAICLVWIVGCSDKSTQTDASMAVDEAVTSTSKPADASTSKAQLIVYRSPTCGCCGDWITHVEQAGITVDERQIDDVNPIKQSLGISREMSSCHTATDGTYVFEGHVPARYISEFLANPPLGAIGLSVPGMPIGSPGMEIDDRFQPYKVILVRADGSSAVFAEVNSPSDQ